ncbi:MAG: hypothetical protein MJH11_21045 [Lentisphaeria bacterium]|nr:hypothetical protein [Lentisphaeria bacterium]
MPTILDAANVPIPETVTGKSMMPIFMATGSGLFDESREYVLMGRENHDQGREGDKGYPVRCIRTQDFLYVRNFEPDRWPAGNPETGFTGCDSGPTKRTVLKNKENGELQHFDLCFGKRPLEELYKMPEDHVCLNNLADSAEHQSVKDSMWSTLEKELKVQEDPRIFGKGDIFDSYPYVGDASHSWKRYESGNWEPQHY